MDFRLLQNAAQDLRLPLVGPHGWRIGQVAEHVIHFRVAGEDIREATVAHALTALGNRNDVAPIFYDPGRGGNALHDLI